MSTWPAMTAGPSSPGLGPPVYQPAGKPLGGTSIDPSVRRPRFISAESTPIEVICRRTGADLASPAAFPTRAAVGLAAGGVQDSARLVAETGGGAAAPLRPEQPVAPMAAVASTATVAIVLQRARAGLLLTRW